MLHGVHAGDVRTTHRGSITDPIHVLPTDSPSAAPVYILYCLRTSYTSSRVSWLCSSLTDAHNVILEHSVCLPVSMRLGSSYTRCMSQCQRVICWLLFLSLMDPSPPLRISPVCCNFPPVQRSPSFSMMSSWLPFVILDRYNAPSCAMSHG